VTLSFDVSYKNFYTVSLSTVNLQRQERKNQQLLQAKVVLDL